MPLRELGEGFHGARIVHLSDLHCSPLVRDDYLYRCLDVVSELEPDFVVFTGDFITVGPRPYARRISDLLARVRARTAKLAVLGNHDYGLWHPVGLGSTRGLAEYLTDQLIQAGIMVLNNSSHCFESEGSVLQFVGTEDPWSPRYSVEEAFGQARRRLPTVALVHNPDAAPDLAAAGAHWVLAGHTHGKRTPDTRLHRAAFPSRCRHWTGGRYSLGNGRMLYVNRGLGHARRVGPEGRPEITVFTLAAEQVQSFRYADADEPADVMT
jgi:predicted MPP superfamily phosphohydrolase